MGTVTRIGVTGGIGSGKSTVCRLWGLLGVPVFDSDSRARRLMNEDRALAAEISMLLGREAYRAGTLDRAWVAARVFGDESLLRALNALVHPAVGAEFLHWAEGFGTDPGIGACPDSDFPVVSQQGRIPYVIMESAILIESGFGKYVDRIVAVTAPEEVRIARATARGGITPQAVRERMARQSPDERYTRNADYVIRNDGQTPLTDQVLAVHRDILKLI